MGQATPNANEAKSKMNHTSETPTPRFELGWQVICGPTRYQLYYGGAPTAFSEQIKLSADVQFLDLQRRSAVKK